MMYEIGRGTGLYCSEGSGARVYLVTRPEPMLVDTGAPGRAGAILRDLASISFQPIQIKRIVLTHHHPGHVGGLWELKRRCGAIACAHRADTPYINGSRPRRAPRSPVERMLHSAVRTVGINELYSASIERRLEDNDEVNGWRVIHTPGHTPGHICLLRGDVLISGDVLVASAGAFRETPHSTSADPVTYRASLRRLAELEFNTILPGHNPPHIVEAGLKVRELVARLGLQETH